MASAGDMRGVAVLMFMLLCRESACTMVTASTEGKTSGAEGKYTANHAPVMARPVIQSQLHQDVVRALRSAQYSAIAALLDNMTQSVIHQGITVFAPSDGALSDFQKRKTEVRLQDVVRFHIVTVTMPFSNLLQLEVGSILKTALSNLTLLVTNTTAGAYQVDRAVIVDPDLYTDATIAVHGINTMFNTSKIIEEPEEPAGASPFEPEEPEGGIPVQGGLPFPFYSPSTPSSASRLPIQVKGAVSVYQILLSFSVLFLMQLTVEV